MSTRKLSTKCTDPLLYTISPSILEIPSRVRLRQIEGDQDNNAIATYKTANKTDMHRRVTRKGASLTGKEGRVWSRSHR